MIKLKPIDWHVTRMKQGPPIYHASIASVTIGYVVLALPKVEGQPMHYTFASTLPGAEPGNGERRTVVECKAALERMTRDWFTKMLVGTSF